MCPRKYGITRILRIKVTMKRTPQVSKTPFFYAPFVAMDSGKCTVPGCIDHMWGSGFSVGCQPRSYGDMAGFWYSLPGGCPQHSQASKTEECRRDTPGAYCGCNKRLGEDSCSYHYEHAGEVRIADITGIEGEYAEFCRRGGLEYDKATDRGRNHSFWDGFWDNAKARARVEAFTEAFRKKYPATPVTLGPHHCEA